MNILLKLIFISLVLVFSYIAFLAYTINQTIHTAKKIISHTIPFEQHPLHPTMHILVAGDSTAVGVGAVDPKASIAGRLGLQFPHADVTNLGVSGAKLEDLLVVLHQQKNHHYDLIIFQIGANDITHFTPYPTMREEISEILLLSTKLGTKTILLTAGNVGNAPMFHWPLSSIITARTLDVRRIFANEAAKYKTVFYIDLFKNLKDDPFNKDIKKYYAPDSFHLTGEGYGIWYLSIQKAL